VRDYRSMSEEELRARRIGVWRPSATRRDAARGNGSGSNWAMGLG